MPTVLGHNLLVLDADATAEGFESLAAASRDAWSAWAGADVDVWA